MTTNGPDDIKDDMRSYYNISYKKEKKNISKSVCPLPFPLYEAEIMSSVHQWYKWFTASDIKEFYHYAQPLDFLINVNKNPFSTMGYQRQTNQYQLHFNNTFLSLCVFFFFCFFVFLGAGETRVFLGSTTSGANLNLIIYKILPAKSS